MKKFSRLYMMVGVPGSGKSSFLNTFHMSDNFVYLSTDSYVEKIAKETNRTYGETFETAITEATKQLWENFDYAIRNNLDIIWDQTNLTASTRRKKLSRVPDTYEKFAVFIETPNEKEHARRLASRPDKFIPESVIARMTAQLEIPTVEEGFDKVFKISS